MFNYDLRYWLSKFWEILLPVMAKNDYLSVQSLPNLVLLKADGRNPYQKTRYNALKLGCMTLSRLTCARKREIQCDRAMVRRHGEEAPIWCPHVVSNRLKSWANEPGDSRSRCPVPVKQWLENGLADFIQCAELANDQRLTWNARAELVPRSCVRRLLSY